MTMARTILGEVFVAILAFAAIYAAVSPILQPITFPRIQIPWFTDQANMVREQYSLVKDTNVSQNVNLVDLNITVKFGGVYIVFSDDAQIAFKAVFQHTRETAELDASRFEDGNKLQVNVQGETGSLNLTLGRNYQYNGSLSVRLGGLVMTLGQNANISKFAVQAKYFGGALLTIKSGASFEQIDMNIDVGGVQLNIDAQNVARNGIIKANVNIGGLSMGVQVDTAQIGVSLESTVDIGGNSVNHEGFIGSVSATHCSVKTLGYNSAANKIDVNANVGLGGVTLQQAIQQLAGFET